MSSEAAEKVGVVTGGSRGIGRAIAERLAADGVRVIVNFHRNATAASEVVSAIESAGGRATAVQADVADPEALRSLFEAAERLYGGLDIWIGNAPAYLSRPVAETSDDDFHQVFTVNTYATFAALREAAQRVRDGGRIVFISTGLTVSPRPGDAVFTASKLAGEQLARVLAKELGPRGVTVNSVLPGVTRTDSNAAMPDGMIEQVIERTPLGRIGEPEDIADVVAFLASDAGRWMTGHSLHAAGGMV